MPTVTILNRKIEKENLPEFTKYLFKNRQKDRREKMPNINEILKSEKWNEKEKSLIAGYTSSIYFLNNRKVQKEIELEGINKEIEFKKRKLDIILKEEK